MASSDELVNTDSFVLSFVSCSNCGSFSLTPLGDCSKAICDVCGSEVDLEEVAVSVCLQTEEPQSGKVGFEGETGFWGVNGVKLNEDPDGNDGDSYLLPYWE